MDQTSRQGLINSIKESKQILEFTYATNNRKYFLEAARDQFYDLSCIILDKPKGGGRNEFRNTIDAALDQVYHLTGEINIRFMFGIRNAKKYDHTLQDVDNDIQEVIEKFNTFYLMGFKRLIPDFEMDLEILPLKIMSDYKKLSFDKELQQELSNKSSELGNIEQNLKALKVNEKETIKKTQIEQEISELEDKKKKISAEINTIDEKRKVIKAEVDRLESLCESANRKKNNLLTENRKLEVEKDKTACEIAKWKSAGASYKNASEEIKRLESYMQKITIESNQLNQEILKSSTLKDEIQGEILKIKNSKEGLEAESQQIHKELKQRQDEKERLEMERTKLDRQVSDLRVLNSLYDRHYSQKWDSGLRKIEGYYCPCDVILKNNGFSLRLKESGLRCNHVFRKELAVILSIVQRSLIYKKSDYVKKIEKIMHESIDARDLLKTQFAILLLIKENLITNQKVSLKVSGINEIVLQVAIKDINNYLEILCNLSGKEYTPFLYDTTGEICLENKVEGEDPINTVDYYIEDYDGNEKLTERSQWHEDNILYKITSENKKYLELLALDLRVIEICDFRQRKSIHFSNWKKAHTHS